MALFQLKLLTSFTGLIKSDLSHQDFVIYITTQFSQFRATYPRIQMLYLLWETYQERKRCVKLSKTFNPRLSYIEWYCRCRPKVEQVWQDAPPNYDHNSQESSCSRTRSRREATPSTSHDRATCAQPKDFISILLLDLKKYFGERWRSDCISSYE